MQVVYEKRSRFSTNIWSITAGWSRVITIWTFYYSLSHVSRRPSRRYKQYPRISGNCSWRKPTKLRRIQIVHKNIWPLFGDPQRYRHQKWRNPFSHRLVRDICHGAKLPWRDTVQCHIFLKALEPMWRPIRRVTLQTTVVEIFAIEISVLG